LRDFTILRRVPVFVGFLAFSSPRQFSSVLIESISKHLLIAQLIAEENWDYWRFLSLCLITHNPPPSGRALIIGCEVRGECGGPLELHHPYLTNTGVRLLLTT